MLYDTSTSCAANEPLALDGLDEFRDDDVEVADDAVVGDLEYRRVLVRVDRDDLGGVLHAGEVLDSTRDAAADHEGGTHRDAGLTDQMFRADISAVHGGATRADRAAERVRKVADQLEVFFTADARAAGRKPEPAPSEKKCLS